MSTILYFLKIPTVNELHKYMTARSNKTRVYEITWADYIRDLVYIRDTNYVNITISTTEL